MLRYIFPDIVKHSVPSKLDEVGSLLDKVWKKELQQEHKFTSTKDSSYLQWKLKTKMYKDYSYYHNSWLVEGWEKTCLLKAANNIDNYYIYIIYIL